MTRRAVQIALFALVAFLAALTGLVVAIVAARASDDAPVLVQIWVLLMEGAAILVAFGVLWLVIVDTIRPPRPLEEPPSPLDDELEPPEPGEPGSEELDELADEGRDTKSGGLLGGSSRSSTTPELAEPTWPGRIPPASWTGNQVPLPLPPTSTPGENPFLRTPIRWSNGLVGLGFLT